MTEDEGVNLVILLEICSEFIQRLLLTLEDIFFVAREAVAS